jgi:glyoxylase I family protein
VASFPVRRIGAILAVADVDRAVAFYTEHLGFDVDALYDDPPYATLTRNGVRLSLAEQGHPAPDRPGIAMAVPDDVHSLPIVLVLEVDDARAVRRRLEMEDVTFLAEPWEAPWGGVRFYVVDPDGYLVEIEQLG